jgi:hypothetical protein
METIAYLYIGIFQNRAKQERLLKSNFQFVGPKTYVIVLILIFQRQIFSMVILFQVGVKMVVPVVCAL